MQALIIYQMEEAKEVKLHSLLIMLIIVALFTGIRHESSMLLDLLWVLRLYP